jgi:hypothetical protein
MDENPYQAPKGLEPERGRELFSKIVNAAALVVAVPIVLFMLIAVVAAALVSLAGP